MDCTSVTAAGRVVARLVETLEFQTVTDLPILPYSKGGYSCHSVVNVTSLPWNEGVVRTIQLGQRIGAGWLLYGDVLNATDAVFSLEHGSTHIPGLRMATWALYRPEDEKHSDWTNGNQVRCALLY